MNKSSQPPFYKERKQTDDSLYDERGKTDEKFESVLSREEGDIDTAVQMDRDEADQERRQQRSDMDLKRDGSDAKNKRHISAERKSEDNAIEKERSNIDMAIDYEREEKERLMKKLVQQERQTTDENLLGERAKTDLEVERSVDLLSTEQAAHLNTKSSLTSREEFVAIVSHDLRNPLGAIVSATELLTEKISVIDDETKQLVDLIKRNAEISLRLISDILDMERVAQGKLQLLLKPHDIGDIIRHSIESHAHLALAKKIVLKASVIEDSEIVNCDRDRIAQVLSNLIGNALKYTPAEGSVTVEFQKTATEIKISVSDTGPGISEVQKNRIFERFAQLGNKDRQGLGLGLYISKMLIEAHKGKLWVVSLPGEGSTFYFTLPKTAGIRNEELH